LKPISKYPNHRAVRAEASEILAMNANRLKLIEALCLCLLLIPLYHAVETLFAAFVIGFVMIPSPVWMWIEKATVFFITLTVTLPLMLGVLGMAERMERGEESDLFDLFDPFSSWLRYAKSVWLSWKVMWLPTTVYFLIWGGSALFDALIVNEHDLLMSKLYLWIGVILLGMLLIMRRFGTLAVNIRRESCPHALERLKGFSGGKKRRCFDKFLGRYLWRIFLGCLSVGIYLLMDVIPHMLIAYFRYCRYLNDNDVTSEE